MKENLKKDVSILKFLLSSVFILTVLSISTKFINGYNQAISEKFSELGKIANNSPQFEFYVFYTFHNHSSFFAIFAFFIFLNSFALNRFTNNHFYSYISFLIFGLSALQATYLSVWFTKLVNIEENFLLIQPDVFDVILYIFFTLTIILQIKIIYRFAIKRFHAKISLK